MSGNFDFPRASLFALAAEFTSARDDDEGRDLVGDSLAQVQQAIRRDREREVAAREAAASARENMRIEAPMPPRRRARAAARSPGMADERTSYDWSSFRPAISSNLASTIASHRQRRLQQERSTLNRRYGYLPSGQDRSSNLSSEFNLLESRLMADDSEPSTEPIRRRAKRRKLDHDTLEPSFQSIKYGHYGQVVPGRLKMEIVSCDGGEYSEDSTRAPYPAENVLRDDKSVYCTESSRCNLLLRQQGEIPFCLQKVVIKAPPQRRFTAPVQEGMIFVSMTSDSLINSTSHYQIQYEDPPSPARTPSPEDGDRLTLLESLNDPFIRSRLHRHESSVFRGADDDRENPPIRPAHSTQNLDDSFEDLFRLYSADNCDYVFGPSDDTTQSAEVTAPTPPPFIVTTESDEHESDEDESNSRTAGLTDRMRRSYGSWRAGSETEEDESQDHASYYPNPRRHWPTFHQDNNSSTGAGGSSNTRYYRAHRRSTPSRIESRDPLGTAPISCPVAPHARFFIEKNKSKITIKFDPPVSGKYILLKLWSPQENGNIDIQSVAAHGYAGPRYFPACEMR